MGGVRGCWTCVKYLKKKIKITIESNRDDFDKTQDEKLWTFVGKRWSNEFYETTVERESWNKENLSRFRKLSLRLKIKGISGASSDIKCVVKRFILKLSRLKQRDLSELFWYGTHQNNIGNFQINRKWRQIDIFWKSERCKILNKIRVSRSFSDNIATNRFFSSCFSVVYTTRLIKGEYLRGNSLSMHSIHY